jgi:hypothetical protein
MVVRPSLGVKLDVSEVGLYRVGSVVVWIIWEQEV